MATITPAIAPQTTATAPASSVMENAVIISR
jgi:hypothetical protein